MQRINAYKERKRVGVSSNGTADGQLEKQESACLFHAHTLKQIDFAPFPRGELCYGERVWKARQVDCEYFITATLKIYETGKVESSTRRKQMEKSLEAALEDEQL